PFRKRLWTTCPWLPMAAPWPLLVWGDAETAGPATAVQKAPQPGRAARDSRMGPSEQQHHHIDAGAKKGRCRTRQHHDYKRFINHNATPHSTPPLGRPTIMQRGLSLGFASAGCRL